MTDYELVEAKIKANVDKIDKLRKENSKLEAQRQKAALGFVKNKKLLGKLDWKLHVYHGGFEIKGSYEGSSANRPEVFKILADKYGMYHYDVKIEPGVLSRFDDEDIILCFSDPSYAWHFAKQWGIKIDTSDLLKSKQSKQDSIKEIDNVIALLSNKDEKNV